MICASHSITLPSVYQCTPALFSSVDHIALIATFTTEVTLLVSMISVDDIIGMNRVLSWTNALVICVFNCIIRSVSKPFLGLMTSIGGNGYVDALMPTPSKTSRDFSDIPSNACSTSDSKCEVLRISAASVALSYRSSPPRGVTSMGLDPVAPLVSTTSSSSNASLSDFRTKLVGLVT